MSGPQVDGPLGRQWWPLRLTSSVIPRNHSPISRSLFRLMKETEKRRSLITNHESNALINNRKLLDTNHNSLLKAHKLWLKLKHLITFYLTSNRSSFISWTIRTNQRLESITNLFGSRIERHELRDSQSKSVVKDSDLWWVGRPSTGLVFTFTLPLSQSSGVSPVRTLCAISTGSAQVELRWAPFELRLSSGWAQVSRGWRSSELRIDTSCDKLCLWRDWTHSSHNLEDNGHRRRDRQRETTQDNSQLIIAKDISLAWLSASVDSRAKACFALHQNVDCRSLRSPYFIRNMVAHGRPPRSKSKSLSSQPLRELIPTRPLPLTAHIGGDISLLAIMRYASHRMSCDH